MNAKHIIRPVVLSLAVLALGACNLTTRLAEVGEAPKMSKVESPTERADYRPVTMPMPTPDVALANPNSLWRPGARAFFRDQRAKEVGDILTVEVEIADDATLSNVTNATRTSDETAGLDTFLGYEGQLSRVLPEAVTAPDLIDLDSTSTVGGTGDITRSEAINVEMAAVVTQVLPNGNLVVAGRQEVVVNYEMRQLEVTGVIRPSDITSSNTIPSEKVAELRVSYGGRGTISDRQQPRYGQQIYDILFPF